MEGEDKKNSHKTNDEPTREILSEALSDEQRLAENAKSLKKFGLIDVERATKLFAQHSVTDYPSLEALLKKFEGGPTFPSLKEAIKKFSEFIQRTNPNFNFFTDLLPSIMSWCSDSPTELPILEAGVEAQVSLTAKEVRGILANAFFLNTKHIPKHEYGDISFLQIYYLQFGVRERNDTKRD